MLGLGENFEEVVEVMKDCRRHNVDMLTLGQYLQPSRDHLPVDRYVHPDEFEALAEEARALGFNEWRAAHWFARLIKRISRLQEKQSASLSPASAAIWFSLEGEAIPRVEHAVVCR